MTGKPRLYWRTEAGIEAWTSPDSGLPAHYRRILGAMKAPMAVTLLARAVGVYDADLLAWLQQLESLGFVQVA